MPVKLRTGTYKYIESILKSYEDYEKHIKLRELEILTPHTGKDENIGGGRSSLKSDPTARTANKLIQDRKLQTLKDEYQAVQKALGESDAITTRIISIWYFKKPRLITWDGVAKKLHLSRSQCIRKRNAFILMVADELGIE